MPAERRPLTAAFAAASGVRRSWLTAASSRADAPRTGVSPPATVPPLTSPVLLAEHSGAADHGQHLRLGTGIAADQDLSAGVDGVPLRGDEAAGDGEGARLGCCGAGGVRDRSGDGVADQGGSVDPGSSVHQVQLSSGAAVARDVAQDRLAVVSVDQFAGAVPWLCPVVAGPA